MILDDVELMVALDPQKMREHVSALPAQCRNAWEQGMALDLPEDLADVRRVVVAGMGGSAIGGDLVRSVLAGRARVPVWVERGYSLPAWVGEDTLVIASSYSGNTEETLSAFEEAGRRGAKRIAVTTGGRLQGMADSAGVRVIPIHYASPPRGALGHSFTLILATLVGLGLAPDMSDEMDEAISVMESWQEEIRIEVPEARNEAKKLAEALRDRFPMVMAGPTLASVARRWKGQFNENAKTWAQFDELPEWDHNGILGMRFPKGLSERATVVYLDAPADPERVRLRWEISRRLMEESGVETRTVIARGKSVLAQVLGTVHFGDFVSLYLAFLNGVDPTEMAAIEDLKRDLAAGNR